MLGSIDHIGLFGPPAAERDDIDFIGIAGAEEAKGENLAEKYNTKLYGSVEDLLAEKLDAVGIFTPFPTRATDIAKCLDLGLHVLCDKPAATNHEGLEAVREAWKRRPDLKLSMGLVNRFLPATRKLKQMLVEGAIGTPVIVNTRKSYPMRRATRPDFMFDSSLSGGEWVELAVHDVDYVRWMTGREYLSVSATHGNGTSPGEPFQDHGAGLFMMEDGLTAFIEHNRLNPAAKGSDLLRFHLSVVGTKGVLDLGDGLTLWNDTTPPTKVTELADSVSVFGNFIDAVTKDEPLVVAPEDVFKVTEVVLAAFRSSEEGGRRIDL
jgi:myo-inositol 2-dehydrogenase/D-chiro-inositol 1-dehydrogenase